MLIVDAIVPVPPVISRRAWECAFDLGGEHSDTIGSPAVWRWLLAVVDRGPEHVTWHECAALFRAHRLYRPVRA